MSQVGPGYTAESVPALHSGGLTNEKPGRKALWQAGRCTHMVEVFGGLHNVGCPFILLGLHPALAKELSAGRKKVGHKRITG